MRYNRDLLFSRYEKMGVTVVDNLEVVTSDDFIDQNWTTEHYMARGRTQIAYNIALAISKEDSTIKVDDLRKIPYLKNNFESHANWKTFGEKSSEMSSSGKYSLKVDIKIPYSETFEVQFSKLFNNMPKKVDVKFKTFSKRNPDKARLVVDIQRNGKSISWQGFELQNLSLQDNWTINQIDVSLPDDIELTDIIKIYLWNNSSEALFVDDFEITFLSKNNLPIKTSPPD